MTYPSSRQDRDALRDIKVKVRYAPEKFAPVNDVPEGTIRELKRWVGYSPVRAKRVLKREISKPSPRIALVRWLYVVLQHPNAQEQQITSASTEKMSE